MEWLKLEGTSKIIQFQYPWAGEQLSLGYSTPDLEGWDGEQNKPLTIQVARSLQIMNCFDGKKRCCISMYDDNMFICTRENS